MLQWGRGLTSAERRGLIHLICKHFSRFNGAADLHPRKGKNTEHRHAGTSWLQWGRGLTSAERLELVELGAVAPARFNGAADLHPRKEPLGRADNPPHDKLQWGRGLTSAERKVGTAKPLRGRAASMGPRTYIRGKRS